MLTREVLQLDGADHLLGPGQHPIPSYLTELEGAADPLLLVYLGAGLVRDVEAQMDRLVALAREQGRSWTEVGRALGVTKQTAWARLARVVADGKAKTVEDAGHGEVLVRSKDDITAGDGAKHDVLAGKAAAPLRG